MREGNQELIAANRLVEVLPALVGQGLSILDALKNSASVNGVVTGAVTGTVAGPGPTTAAASTPSIEAD